MLSDGFWRACLYDAPRRAVPCRTAPHRGDGSRCVNAIDVLYFLKFATVILFSSNNIFVNLSELGICCKYNMFSNK